MFDILFLVFSDPNYINTIFNDEVIHVKLSVYLTATTVLRIRKWWKRCVPKIDIFSVPIQIGFQFNNKDSFLRLRQIDPFYQNWNIVNRLSPEILLF